MWGRRHGIKGEPDDTHAWVPGAYALGYVLSSAEADSGIGMAVSRHSRGALISVARWGGLFVGRSRVVGVRTGAGPYGLWGSGREPVS